MFHRPKPPVFQLRPNPLARLVLQVALHPYSAANGATPWRAPTFLDAVTYINDWSKSLTFRPLLMRLHIITIGREVKFRALPFQLVL